MNSAKLLTKRNYWWKDMLYLPFRCAPVCTVLACLQKALTAFANIFLVLAVANLVDAAIARASGDTGGSDLLLWFGIVMLLSGWKRISYFVGRLFGSRAEIFTADRIAKEAMEKRARLPYQYMEDKHTLELADRLFRNIEKHTSEMFLRSINFFFVYIIRIIGIFIIIFSQVWWLGFVTGLLIIPLIILSLKSGKVIYESDQEAAEAERRHQYYLEVLTGRETVEERTVFRYKDFIQKRWQKNFDRTRKAAVKAEIAWAKGVHTGSIPTNIVSTGIILIMLPLVSRGQMSVGMFIALATGVYDLVKLLGWELSRAVSQMARYHEYMKDLTRFMALPEREDYLELPARNQEFEALEFRNVTFCYPGSTQPILKNLSFQMEKGRHYAFVGENGAGKSTIVKLMTGLYDGYEGEILLNGRELHTFSPGQLKAVYAGVYQDFARYFISAEDNILLGNIRTMHSPAGQKRLHNTLKDLDILKELEALPQGLKTPLGKLSPEGAELSGGQWQRLAIARALVSDAGLQILDEPTAALDPVSESRLYEQFEQVSRDKTTLFISHRLGATKLAECIFVLKNGSVSEQGSHHQLLLQDGLYARMYQSQKSWYETEVSA